MVLNLLMVVRLFLTERSHHFFAFRIICCWKIWWVTRFWKLISVRLIWCYISSGSMYEFVFSKKDDMIILVDRNLISSKLFLRWIDLWYSLLGVGTCCPTRWTYWSTVYNLSEINSREWITGVGVLCGLFLGFLTKIIC